MKAVVTGASSGIGCEFTKILCNMGYVVYAVARRKERLLHLADEIGDNFIPMVFDLSSDKDCYEMYDRLKDEEINLLINNAGFGLFGNFSDTSLQREIEMLNVNVRSVHILTKLFSQKFLKDGNGRILNVASSAGFMMGPLLSSYYASKAYVLRLSEAVDEELKRRNKNVRVSVLCPGPVKTEFDTVANVSFSLKGLDSQYVASYALKKMFAGKRVIIPGFTVKLLVFISRFVPDAVLSKITYHIQKKKDK